MYVGTYTARKKNRAIDIEIAKNTTSRNTSSIKICVIDTCITCAEVLQNLDTLSCGLPLSCIRYTQDAKKFHCCRLSCNSKLSKRKYTSRKTSTHTRKREKERERKRERTKET